METAFFSATPSMSGCSHGIRHPLSPCMEGTARSPTPLMTRERPRAMAVDDSTLQTGGGGTDSGWRARSKRFLVGLEIVKLLMKFTFEVLLPFYRYHSSNES